jgi:hypothetical protein
MAAGTRAVARLCFSLWIKVLEARRLTAPRGATCFDTLRVINH